jgi:hypothetical protein
MMNRMRSALFWLFPPALALGAAGSWLGCEETGFIPNAVDAGPVTDGAGCLDTLPSGFPYKPGCCDYSVSAPSVTEAGFSAAVLGPAPAPDHVHASWAGETSTTFAVNWRTDPGTLASELLYGTDEAAVAAAGGPDGGPGDAGPPGGVRRVLGHHLLYGSIFDGENRTRVHEAHVCGLAPSTRYFYKVGAPGAWSPVFEVATAPEVGSTEPFSFGVTGDSRNDPTIWAEIQAAVASQGVDFQLFSGDAVVIGQNQTEWNAFFEATAGATSVQSVLASTPFMIANGNHDALAINLVSQFAMPQELSPGETDPEEWYSFDYGNAHFVFLNDTTVTNSEAGPQRDWLEADLAAVDRQEAPWIFVVHHKPTYSCSTNHGSDTDLRAVWQPVFDRYQVDLVFNGHDHDYERSKPIRGFQEGSTEGALAQAGTNGAPVAQSGTVYVVAAGAGAPLYGVDPSCYHTFVTESVRNYVVIDVEGRTLRYKAYRQNGTELDAFEYTK